METEKNKRDLSVVMICEKVGKHSWKVVPFFFSFRKRELYETWKQGRKCIGHRVMTNERRVATRTARCCQDCQRLSTLSCVCTLHPHVTRPTSARLIYILVEARARRVWNFIFKFVPNIYESKIKLSDRKIIINFFFL